MKQMSKIVDSKLLFFQGNAIRNTAVDATKDTSQSIVADIENAFKSIDKKLLTIKSEV